VTTPSGALTPIDLLNAHAQGALSLALAKGVGIAVDGDAQGMTSWKAALHIKKPDALLRSLAHGLRVLIARCIVASFFDVSKFPPQPDPEDKAVLDFLFSNKLSDEFAASAARLLAKVDQTPNTPDEIEIDAAGAGAAFTINGKEFDALLTSLADDALAEARHLREFAIAEMQKTAPQFAAAFASMPF
jgi:hypothetical protein